MLSVGDREGDWIVEDMALPGESRLLRVVNTRGDTHGVLRLFAKGDEGRAAADRAGEALRAFDHPSIPSLLDQGQTREGEAWIVTEPFEGRTIGDIIAFEPLDVFRAARIFERLGEAIAHVHEQGWIHRDINPEKVVIADDDQVHLIGFEHALTLSALRDIEDPTFGPLAYVAPEVLRRYTDHGHRADLYSTGVILYEAVTGRSAFPAAMMDTSADPRARAQVWKSRDKVLDPGDQVPHWLAGLVRKSTQPDPRNRLKDHYALLGWLDAARDEWEVEEEGDAPSLAPPAPIAMGAPSLMPSIGPSIGPPPMPQGSQSPSRTSPPAPAHQVVYQQEAPPPALYDLAAALLGAIAAGVVSFLVIAIDQG
ncbi:MAG: hypothetical protein EP330_01405 [Deltaproteobacteria bacterium]|nr:MAG: hypothetical protein EP330_01405 [Deltaproteobacteria bacterium]